MNGQCIGYTISVLRIVFSHSYFKSVFSVHPRPHKRRVPGLLASHRRAHLGAALEEEALSEAPPVHRLRQGVRHASQDAGPHEHGAR